MNQENSLIEVPCTGVKYQWSGGGRGYGETLCHVDGLGNFMHVPALPIINVLVEGELYDIVLWTKDLAKRLSFPRMSSSIADKIRSVLPPTIKVEKRQGHGIYYVISDESLDTLCALVEPLMKKRKQREHPVKQLSLMASLPKGFTYFGCRI